MTDQNKGLVVPFISVTTLFFAWGFITATIGPLIAAVKGIYRLSDREALLTQFAFFIAYLAVVVWWIAIPPSQDREWRAQGAVLARACAP